MDPQALLKTAVSQIIAHIGTGMVPNDATVKVANELQLNLNFIKRATEVVNVALTYDHFKKHAESKDADFPIVDSAKVAQAVYREPTRVKKAAAQSVDPAEVSPDLARYLCNPQFKQAYHRICSVRETQTELTKSALFDKAYAALASVESQLENLRSKQAGHQEGYTRAFASLAGRFNLDPAYRASFASVEKQAQDLYGAKASPYLELLHKTAAAQEPRADEFTGPAPARCKEAALFTRFISEIGSFGAAQTQLDKLAAEASDLRNFRDKIHGGVGRSRLSEPEIVKTSALEEPKAAEQEAAEPGIEDPVKAAALRKQAEMDQGICPVEEKAYLTPAQSASLPPALKKRIIEAKRRSAPVAKLASFDLGDFVLKKYEGLDEAPGSKPLSGHAYDLQRKLLLQHLIYTDPILSQRAPREVADAYQSMLRLAPELSLEPDVVKSLLRTSVESQSLDPHAAGLLIDTDANLVKQRSTQASGPKAKAH